MSLATDLREHTDVATALWAGNVSVDQTTVIVRTLQQLPEHATPDQAGRVEAGLLEHAKTFDPVSLRRIGHRLIEGEAFIQVITAHAVHAAWPALDTLDTLGAGGEAGRVSPAQRRDALMALVARHQQHQLAPDHGGDRPRVTITLSYQDLIT